MASAGLRSAVLAAAVLAMIGPGSSPAAAGLSAGGAALRGEDLPGGLWSSASASDKIKVCACVGAAGKGVHRCEDDAHAVACGELVRDYSGSGWAELRIDTNPAAHHAKVSGTTVGEAAGFVEGVLTAPEIAELRARFAGGAVRPAEEQAHVDAFARQQWPAVERTVAAETAKWRSGTGAEATGESAALGPSLAGAGRAYWAAAALVLAQLRGLAAGYRHEHNRLSGAGGAVSAEEALRAVVALNYDVDAFDVTDAVRGGGGYGPGDGSGASGLDGDQGGGRFRQRRRRAPAGSFDEGRWALLSRRGRCTAAVVAHGSCVEGGSGPCGVEAVHSTWGDYSELVRLYKRVDWSGARTRLFGAPSGHARPGWWAEAERGVASWRLSMSSYPGMVSSTDDWLQLGSGVLATETTISAADPSALGRIASTAATASDGPSAPLQPFPAFLRSMLASWVAPSAAAWARAFASRSGGTSNSQWLLVDFNAIPGKAGGAAAAGGGGAAAGADAGPGRPPPRGLFVVLEQSQRRVMAADATPVLLGKARGLWPSSNRPLLAPVRRDLGYPPEVSRSPIVRAAAAALGAGPVAAPEGTDTSGEDAPEWGLAGLWELRAGERLTDLEAGGGGETAGGGGGGEGSFRETRGHDGDAAIDVHEGFRFRESTSSSSSSSSSPDAQPWLGFGRHRRRLAPRGGPSSGGLPLAPMRFVGVAATARRSRAAAAREQYDDGFAGPTASGAGWYSFDANPRAEQLRAAASSVDGPVSALRLGRLNNWPHGPLSHGKPYFAPAARFDLAPPSDQAAAAFGAVDAKATSTSLMASLASLAVAGPSRGDGWRTADVSAPGPGGGHRLPAFDWRTWRRGGVCGQETNPAEGEAAGGDGAGSEQCSCGPAWAVRAHRLPCCWGCGDEGRNAPVPRAVTVGA